MFEVIRKEKKLLNQLRSNARISAVLSFNSQLFFLKQTYREKIDAIHMIIFV